MIDFFYSDPHFGHERIIELCGRPFDNSEHMTEQLVERYNATVGKGDFVLWVGDCFFLPKDDSRALLDRLHGGKGLVIGNHDSNPSRMLELGFEFVVDTLKVRMANRTVNVCHYPYASPDDEDLRYPEKRPPRVRGQALIHGHTHSSKKRIGTAVHVGVDAWDFRPAPWADVAILVGDAFQ